MLKNESLLGFVMIPIHNLTLSVVSEPLLSSLYNMCLFFEIDQVDKTFTKAIKYVTHQLVDYILSN